MDLCLIMLLDHKVKLKKFMKWLGNQLFKKLLKGTMVLFFYMDKQHLVKLIQCLVIKMIRDCYHSQLKIYFMKLITYVFHWIK